MFDFVFDKLMHKFLSDGDIDCSFRVTDEDGKDLLNTHSPEEFRAFLEGLKAAADQQEKKLCDHDCATCDSCEDEYEDDFDEDDWDEDDYDDDVIFEIPVAGVAAAAALIGSVALLIRALRKR